MTKGPSTSPDSEWDGPKHSLIPSKSQMTTPSESPQSFEFGSLSISSKETEEKEQGAAGYLDIQEMPGGSSGECVGVEEQAGALQFSVSPASSQLQLGEQKAESSEERVTPGEPLGKHNGSFLDSRVGNQFPTLIRSFQVVTSSMMQDSLWERARICSVEEVVVVVVVMRAVASLLSSESQNKIEALDYYG